MYKAFCRAYQGVFKIGMYLLPWSMPKTIEGAGSIRQLPALIKEKGFTKVLIVTDGVLMKIGLLDSLLEAMAEAGVEYVIYDGVQPNPTDINVAEGVKLFRENGCQAFIAFGGGSPMDCCKGILICWVCPLRAAGYWQRLLPLINTHAITTSRALACAWRRAFY